MFTDVVGYFAGLCLAVSFLPQVVKTYRSKTAEDVSMGLLSLSLASAVGYEFYAWQLGLIPVVVMNGIFLVLVFVEIVLKLKFDGWKHSNLASDESDVAD